MANTYFQSQYGHQILLDGDGHARRWLDAFGPDVFKLIEDFVGAPVNATSGEYDELWTITRVEAGAGESTFGPGDGQGGLGVITTDANENDGINAQRRGEAFKLTTAARLYFGIRFKVSDATQSDYFVGLAITDTDILGGCTDHIGFDKVDGTTDVEAFVNKDSARTEVASAVMTQDADTYHTLEFFWDGPSNRVYFYVDNEETTRLTSFANTPNDEDLRVSLHFLAGAAAVKTMTIDWLRCIQIGRAS